MVTSFAARVGFTVVGSTRLNQANLREFQQQHLCVNGLTSSLWHSERKNFSIEPTCTANGMKPLAAAAGFDPPVHKWNPAERAQLTAELDAAYFLLYGIDRDDAEYMLGTFAGLRGGEDAAILAAFDRLSGG